MISQIRAKKVFLLCYWGTDSWYGSLTV